MKTALMLALLLSASFVLAQDANSNQMPSNNKNGQITVRGCIDRQSGDYVLIKADPGNTYELQGSRSVNLGDYLGQRVEVTGTESQTMEKSSDEENRMGSPSPVTITVSSIKSISKECQYR